MHLQHSLSCPAACLVASTVVSAQAIKLQIGPDQVERATLFIMHVQASAHDMRVGAMHHRSPIHTFMFDSNGALLVGNASAVESCRRGTSGASFCRHDACALIINMQYHDQCISFACCWYDV